jgi:hypothetical protein
MRPLLYLSLLAAAACAPPPLPECTFYHWQTACGLDPQEQARLAQHEVRRLYVRVFDVDWDAERQAVMPLATASLDSCRSWAGEWAPVVYLTNRSLLNSPQDSMAPLAGRIFSRVRRLTDGLAVRELQLDCDWSDGTREKFFALAGALREAAAAQGWQLSATIRLHQVKYARRTGVPPVDRGMLMFYNMGDLSDPGTENSILDLQTASAYLTGFQRYPLELDVALPLFAWGVVLRGGKPVQLLQELDAAALADRSRFSGEAPDRYTVTQSTYLSGHYLYTGDQIRVERVAPDTLLAAAAMLRGALPRPPRRVAFYHLQSQLLQQYPHETLASALELLR